MSTRNHIPNTVNASLGARLAPFNKQRSLLDDLDIDIEASQAVTPQASISVVAERSQRPGLINDLKLLFAALGAGGSVVPLGDNGRTARLLAEYANSLRQH
jgi:hypothetical protein